MRFFFLLYLRKSTKMKTSKYSFALLFLLSFNTFSSDIKWHTVDDLLSGKNRDNKPIFLYMHTEWDGFSKKMNTETLTSDPISKELNSSFFNVKFNLNDSKTYSYKNKTYKPNSSGIRAIHPLSKLWIGKENAFPTSVILDIALNPVIRKTGFIPSFVLLDFLKIGKTRSYTTQNFTPNMFVLNICLQKILDDYENDFKNIRGKKRTDEIFDTWDSKVKILGEISSEVGVFAGDKPQAYYRLNIAKNVSIEEGKNIIVKWTNIIKQSNLKTLLGASFLGYKSFDKGNESSMQFIIGQQSKKFEEIEVALKLELTHFSYKDDTDVFFIIRKR